MKSTTAVSVIMPLYNCGDFVVEALESVRAQTFGDWEVCIVDDCSTDNSRELVRNYVNRTGDKRIYLIEQESNQGVSAARNRGIAHTTGDWIAFLDPDDTWESDWLATAMREKDHADFVFARLDVFGPTKGRKKWLGPGPLRRAFFPKSIYWWNFILPSGVVVKRSSIVDAGMFDEDPEIQHVEDWDLWLRMAQQGIRMYYILGHHCNWRRHELAASDRGYAQALVVEQLFRKHMQCSWSLHRRIGASKSQTYLAYWVIRSQPDRGWRLILHALRNNPFYPVTWGLAIVALGATIAPELLRLPLLQDETEP